MKKQNEKKKSNKSGKIAKAGYIAAGVAAAAIVSGCSSDKEKWKESPGTNGHINLDAVKKCFQKYPKLPDFEKRINEIYEGDNLIILKSEKGSKRGFVCKAYEDLDKDKKVSIKDDALFTLTVSNGMAMLQGLGVNSYYYEKWPYDPLKHKDAQATDSRYHRHRHHGFYYWYYSPFRRYYTPGPRYDTMQAHRSSYRQSSAFQGQVKDNLRFEQRASSRYGSNFRKSTTKISSARKSYINTSSAYKSSGSKSGWSVRSSKMSGSRSSFSSARSSGRSGFGGFRGGSGLGI